jgi:hypothetical protein
LQSSSALGEWMYEWMECSVHTFSSWSIHHTQAATAYRVWTEHLAVVVLTLCWAVLPSWKWFERNSSFFYAIYLLYWSLKPCSHCQISTGAQQDRWSERNTRFSARRR